MVSKGKIQIRPIETKDNEHMERIIKRSLESVGLDIPGTAYFDPQLGQLAEYYAVLPKANYWVLVDENDAVLGGVGIAPFEGQAGTCELQKLYLANEAQGQGLSSVLMETALEFAAQHYRFCYLETMQKLVIANKVYTKFGFELLDEPLPGSDHGTMDAWYLKRLNKNREG